MGLSLPPPAPVRASGWIATRRIRPARARVVRRPARARPWGVSPALVQRQAALAAAAVLATLSVLALSRHDEEATSLRPTPPEVRWDSAVVGVLSPKAYERETSCGSTLD